MIRLALSLVLVWTVVSCKTMGNSGQLPPNDPETYYLANVEIKECGIVLHVIIGDVISYYSPINLDPKFQVDGMRLKLKFKEDKTLKTTCKTRAAIDVTEAFPVR